MVFRLLTTTERKKYKNDKTTLLLLFSKYCDITSKYTMVLAMSQTIFLSEVWVGFLKDCVLRNGV